MNKYLPFILFGICILMAVILAISMPGLWPAALAIAISGAAMAIALRLQLISDSTEPSDEIADLKKANADLRAEIQNTYSIIDELADVVEQVATVTADGDGVSREDVEGLRTQIATIQATPAPVLPPPPADDRIDEILIRMSALEGEVQSVRDSHDATLSLTQVASATEATPDAASGVQSGNLRSLMARAGGGAAIATAASVASVGAADSAQPEPEETTIDGAPAPAPAAASGDTPSPADNLVPVLAPVFEPDLGSPIAFILSAEGARTDDDVSALLKHGTQISEELEAAGREVLLFLRLPPKALERITVRREIIAAIDGSTALQRRLTMLTTQTGFDASVQNTLMSIADSGCKFALESIADWSLDLAGLAKSGLRFIVVDGLAMANSAVQQGGDPRRLAQALAAHDIALIGGLVADKNDMDAVRSLEPTLVTGDGLGEARVLEAAV